MVSELPDMPAENRVPTQDTKFPDFSYTKDNFPWGIYSSEANKKQGASVCLDQ